MKRMEITKKMLESLPSIGEIQTQGGDMYELLVKFPEWFAERYPEEAVRRNVNFAINWNPEYVCKQEPEQIGRAHV